MADENEISEGEQLAKALREAQPAWIKDGTGIRGPAATRSSPDVDQYRRSDSPPGSVTRQPIAEVAQKSESDLTLETKTVVGAYNGEPATLDVYANGDWTPIPEE